MQACGVCHTDLHYREGGINDDFPFLLGHEAAGVVSAVGEGVTNVAVGDYVILNWRAVCGQCRACAKGKPWYCFDTHNAAQKMTLADGTELSPALGIGAFAEKTLVALRPVHEGRPGRAADGRRPARLRRHGRHRRGHQHRRRRPRATPSPSSAAAASGTPRSPAPGWPARRRSSPSTSTTGSSSGPRAWAPPTRSTRKDADPVEAIKELTGGFGVDVAIDAVGHPAVYEQAFYARDLAGTVVLVGVPNPAMTIELPLIEVFGRGGALKSSWYGDCLPSRDFPMLIDLYLQGRFDLDAFVTETIGLDDVEAGVREDAPRRGAAVGRGVRE